MVAPSMSRTGIVGKRPVVEAAAFAIFFLVPAVIAIAVLLQNWVEPSLLTRDPIAVARDLARLERAGKVVSPVCCPMYTGILSNFGVIVWAQGIGLLLVFAATGFSRGWHPYYRHFALAGAILTTLLVLDDGLMVHEILERRVWFAGKLLLGLYALFLVVYTWLFRAVIFRFAGLLFTLSVLMFGASVAVDLAPFLNHYGAALEDAPKFVAICCWTGSHGLIVYRLMSQPREMSYPAA